MLKGQTTSFNSLGVIVFLLFLERSILVNYLINYNNFCRSAPGYARSAQKEPFSYIYNIWFI